MQESTSRFDFSQEYAHQSELHGMEGRPWTFGEGVHHGPQWALLVFSQPVTAPAVSPPPYCVFIRHLVMSSPTRPQIIRLSTSTVIWSHLQVHAPAL